MFDYLVRFIDANQVVLLRRWNRVGTHPSEAFVAYFA
jgi:hypothetical protein